MLLRVATGSPEPIYQQLVRQVRAAVASGALRPGDKVPSLREVAAQLVINHLTVKRAFDQLEAEGVIGTRRGIGTFVAAAPPARLPARESDLISAELSRSAEAARGLGLKRADWLRLAGQAWKDSDHEHP